METASKDAESKNHLKEDFEKSKPETVRELGFTKKQTEQFQKIAEARHILLYWLRGYSAGASSDPHEPLKYLKVLKKKTCLANPHKIRVSEIGGYQKSGSQVSEKR